MNLTIKKKEQGINTRLSVGLLLALVGSTFCYTVYGTLVNRSFFGLRYVGVDFNWGHAAAFVAGAGWLAATLWIVLFSERTVDFLIQVDREAKKITWPGWDQLRNSVLVVIGVIVFFGIVAGAFDMIFLAGIWKGLLGLK